MPAGHYILKLADPHHCAIANRLKDSAYTEEEDKRVWINVIYEEYTTTVKHPACHGPPLEWKSCIPSRGTLVLDYVSFSTRPETLAMEDEEMWRLLQEEVGGGPPVVGLEAFEKGRGWRGG